MVILILSWICDSNFNPGCTLQKYTEIIFWTYQIQLSTTWVHNVFTNLMRFSYRKINVLQKAKFTEENINYYYTFVNFAVCVSIG